MKITNKDSVTSDYILICSPNMLTAKKFKDLKKDVIFRLLEKTAETEGDTDRLFLRADSDLIDENGTLSIEAHYIPNYPEN